jgi:hypothetical protein
MEQTQIAKLINEAVRNMISHSTSNEKIQSLTERHKDKIHYIPIKYRVLGGVLQSMNIQFGNFIEELIKVLVQNESGYDIIEELSGKKNTKFLLSSENDTLIDQYITKCQTGDITNIRDEFPKLLNKIVNNKDTSRNEFKHDIDLLFKDSNNNQYYYLEIKYNDDHDTGKFVDINRKFIKTYAYLINYLNIKDSKQLMPILFFFNNKKMKGNIYIPEETNIFRGKRFFDEFLSVPYEAIDEYMANLSESTDVYNMFDELYNQIRYGE